MAKLIVTGGVIYLVTCYLPFIEYSPPFFVILGTLILVRNRSGLHPSSGA